jgi:glutaredoxin
VNNCRGNAAIRALGGRGVTYRVYWQPGCTSCLRTKEFLTRHGIEFESINVREVEGAMAELQSLGLRSVPVVAHGDRGIYAQELREVASFVGVPMELDALPPAELIRRLDRILAAAQRYLRQLPDTRLADRLPGRTRTWRDLGYHLFVIPLGFLDAARGGELTEEHFQRKPPDSMQSWEAIAGFGAAVRVDLQRWWDESGSRALPAQVRTYYGDQPADKVLERTCWHVAQHVRQLAALLELAGVEPDQPLGPAELAGLPLPQQVWDAEVPLGPESPSGAV